MLETIIVIILSVAAILATQTARRPITDHWWGRVALAAGITALVLWGVPWCAMPAPDAILAMYVGTAAMTGILWLALGPPRYDMRFAPGLITVSRMGYRRLNNEVMLWNA